MIKSVQRCKIINIKNLIKVHHKASSLSSFFSSFFFGFFAFTITSSITRGFILVKSMKFSDLFAPKGVMQGMATRKIHPLL